MKKKHDPSIFIYVEPGVVQEALARVDAVDLSRQAQLLKVSTELSAEEIRRVEVSYRRWLALNLCYPNLSLSPSQEVDIFWHYHILDTPRYRCDCGEIFGKYLDHSPSFDAEASSAKFEVTRQLWQFHFGETLHASGNCDS